MLDVLANYLTSGVNLKSLDIHEKEQIPSHRFFPSPKPMAKLEIGIRGYQ